MSAYIRFKTFSQFVTDSILGFVLGYSLYQALQYFIEEGSIRSGISGMVILWSRPLYDFVTKFIHEHLIMVIEKVLKK